MNHETLTKLCEIEELLTVDQLCTKHQLQHTRAVRRAHHKLKELIKSLKAPEDERIIKPETGSVLSEYFQNRHKGTGEPQDADTGKAEPVPEDF